MRADELRGREAEDLRAELAQLRRQLFDVKFARQAEETPDTSHQGKVRRDIARVLTVLREKELASRKQEQAAEQALSGKNEHTA